MSKKLFLADDSVTIQKVVELILADEGFDVRVFSNGEEAWNAMRQERPDIVLADIEMPGMNGYQLCERIKADTELSDIPVVLLAGAFEPIDEELARDVKADDYIVKPFESEELISKINALLTEKGEFVEVAEAEEAEPEVAVEAEEEAPEGVFAFEEESEVEALDITEEVPTAETGMEEVMTSEEEAPPEEVTPEVKRTEAPETAMPSVSEDALMQTLSSLLDEKVKELFNNIDAETLVSQSLDRVIGPQLEKVFTEKVSPAVEESIKKTVEELTANFKKEIERIIWETVPDLAETIITKEIERIKSTF